jgi:hypothetical protein
MSAPVRVGSALVLASVALGGCHAGATIPPTPPYDVGACIFDNEAETTGRLGVDGGHQGCHLRVCLADMIVE